MLIYHPFVAVFWILLALSILCLGFWMLLVVMSFCALDMLNSEAISDAFFKKDVFWILFLLFGCTVIFLHGFSGSILLNLSSVSAAIRSLRRLRGSMFASTSQALEGVDFSAPLTNRRASFCLRSSFFWLCLLAVICSGAE